MLEEIDVRARGEEIAHKYGFETLDAADNHAGFLFTDPPEDLAWAIRVDACIGAAEAAARKAYRVALGKELAGYISLADYLRTHEDLSIDDAKKALRQIVREKQDYLVANHEMLEQTIGYGNCGIMLEALCDWSNELADRWDI